MSKKYWQNLVAIPLILLGLMALTAAYVQADDNPAPHIIPPDARVGFTYEEFTARWNQWAFSIPEAINPVLDTTGANAGKGQSGSVFYLAGTFGGTVVRNVTIPRGKKIFFPVVNAEWDTVPGFANPLGLPDPLSVADIRRIVAYFIDNATFSCEIDGVPVRNLHRFRVQSPVLSFTFHPTMQVLLGYPSTFTFVETAVSDGIWLMLRPLSPGSHRIHFTASIPAVGFSLNLTYNITVTP